MATILVVDDEPAIRTLVRASLDIDGHEIVEAGSGTEALDAVAARRPEAVVLDLMMPGVSGWDVLSALKADVDEAVRTIPVVVLTALGGAVDRARGGIEGAVRYLAKPVDEAELRRAVDEALSAPEPEQRRRARQEALQELARAEGGGHDGYAGPRPRLCALEAPRERRGTGHVELDRRLATLTAKQRELLDLVARARTVREAADRLRTSRANVYAGLRRVARRLDLDSVPELLELARAGKLSA